MLDTAARVRCPLCGCQEPHGHVVTARTALNSPTTSTSASQVIGTFPVAGAANDYAVTFAPLPDLDLASPRFFPAPAFFAAARVPPEPAPLRAQLRSLVPYRSPRTSREKRRNPRYASRRRAA